MAGSTFGGTSRRTTRISTSLLAKHRAEFAEELATITSAIGDIAEIHQTASAQTRFKLGSVYLAATSFRSDT